MTSIKQRISAFIGAVLVATACSVTLSAVAQAADSPAGTPAALAVPVPLAAVSKEVVDNPYGFDAVWKGGDFVARGTLIILAIMSMGTWYTMIVKLIDQNKIIRQGNEARKNFWSSSTIADGINSLKEGSPYKFVAGTAVDAAEHHEGKLMEQVDRNTWIAMSVERAVGTVQSRLQDGLAVLATVGSTSPFVGLFGTVWGIYHALTAIGIAGQASIDKVAGPVGEALIMTALGLAVAVPAVLGYNWLVRRNKAAMELVRAFSADLHVVLLGGRTPRPVKQG